MALQTQLLFGDQRHYYLCHYKAKAAGSDRLSQSLLRFKSGCDVDVEAWCSCAVEELNKLDLPKNTLILRALSSSETTVTANTGLDRLGASLQDELKFHYDPVQLSKSRLTLPLKQLSKKERQTELADTYHFNKTHYNIEWPAVLILDDILTTGATLQAIITAIRQKIPNCSIIGFTLALSERTAPLNTSISLQSNAYKWQQPGGWIMQETDPDYITLESLKTAIRSNFESF